MREGLPTVVRQGTRGFPARASAGKRLLAGGPGGPALLEQQVSLRSRRGVANTISGTLTPVDIRSRRGGRSVSVGVYAYPTAIAVVPGAGKAIVVGTYGGNVSLVNTRTRRRQATTRVGRYPVAVALAAK